MGNPFTELIRSSMENPADREARMKERVAYNAINSVQWSEERKLPSKLDKHWQIQRQQGGSANMNYYNAHSAYKNKAEGRANSFEAHEFYAEQAKAKREALLKEMSES